MNSEGITETTSFLSATAAAESLPAPVAAPLGMRCLKSARREAIDRFEVEYVRALLLRSQGNVTRAAAMAEVSRQVIHKLIAKHGL